METDVEIKEKSEARERDLEDRARDRIRLAVSFTDLKPTGSKLETMLAKSLVTAERHSEVYATLLGISVVLLIALLVERIF